MRFLHTMVRAKDLDESLDFYCNKLGLIEVQRYDSEAGRFTLPDSMEMLAELRMMIEHPPLSRGLFMANHASNYLPIKARLPHDREVTLQLIDSALKGEVPLRPEWYRGL